MGKRAEFTEKTKNFVRERQNRCCAVCGKHEDHLFLEESLKVQFHHVLPASVQGTNKTFNCVMLCDDCHEHIHINGNYRVPIVNDLDDFPYANMDKHEVDNFYKSAGNVMLDYMTADDEVGSLSQGEAIDRIKRIFGSNWSPSFMIDNQGKGAPSDEGRVEKNYNRPRESRPAHSDASVTPHPSGNQVHKVVDSTKRSLRSAMPKFSMSDEMLAKGRSTTQSTSRQSSGSLPSFKSQLRQGAAVIANSDNMRGGAEDLKNYQRYLHDLCDYTEDLLRQASSSWQDSDYQALYRAWRSVREKIEAFQHNLHRDIKHLENKAVQIDNYKQSS